MTDRLEYQPNPNTRVLHDYIRKKNDADGDNHKETWRVGYENKANPKDPKPPEGGPV